VCCVVFLVCLYVCVFECLLHTNIAGVPSSRATSGFPQYCTSTCVCFGSTRHASRVDSKPKKKKEAVYSFSGFIPTNKQTNKLHPLVLPPPSRISLPSHLYRWSAKTTAVMDGSGPHNRYNVYLPGWQQHARTFQDHAESIRCNLNSDGDGRRGTHTGYQYVEDRQAHARAPWGVGVR